MKIKGIKLLAALAIAACANGLAYAGTYKIDATIDVLTSRGVYHVRNSANNTYAQVSGLKQTETVVRGEGPFSAINKQGKKDDTDVVGVDIKGHSELALEKLPNGNVLTSVDILIDDVIDGTPVNVESKYKATAQFTRGTWEDYKAGNSVELQLTEEGQKMAVEAVTANLKKMLLKMKDALSAQLQAAGAEFSEITLERLEVRGKSVIKGTSSRLEITGAPTTVGMSFLVKADF
jgi:hypothetical protein